MPSEKDKLSLAGPAIILSAQLVSSRYCLDCDNLPKLLVLSLGCWWSIASSAKEMRQNGGTNLAWFWFLASMLLSLSFSVDPRMSLCGVYYAGYETVLLGALCFLAYQAGMQAHGRGEELRRAGIIIGSLAAIYGLGQLLGLSYHGFSGASGGRIMGTIGQPAFFGIMMACAWAMVLPELGKDLKNSYMLLPIAAAMIATQARGPMMAVILASLYYFRPMVKLRLALIPAGLILLAIYALGRNVHMQSDIMRIAQNKVAWLAFLKHPILGYGPATFCIAFIDVQTKGIHAMMDGWLQTHSHNMITNILATQGIVGLVAWCVLGASAWLVSERWVRGMLLSMFVCGMFNPIPPTCYAACALFFGVQAGGKDQAAPSKNGRGPLLVSSLLILLWLVVMCQADHRVIGATVSNQEPYARAAAINPLELLYSPRPPFLRSAPPSKTKEPGREGSPAPAH